MNHSKRCVHLTAYLQNQYCLEINMGIFILSVYSINNSKYKFFKAGTAIIKKKQKNFVFGNIHLRESIDRYKRKD